MAQKLSTDFKLSARTAPSLHEAFSHLVLRAAAEGVKFRKRKIGVEAAVNAVLIDFLDKTEAEQLAILRRNVVRFESSLEAGQAPEEEPTVKPIVRPTGVSKRSGTRRKDA